MGFLGQEIGNEVGGLIGGYVGNKFKNKKSGQKIGSMVGRIAGSYVPFQHGCVVKPPKGHKTQIIVKSNMMIVMIKNILF